MNKYGPHFQQLTNDMLNLIAEWQPAVAVWVDPNPEGITRIRQASPSTFLVGRRFEEGSWDSPALKDRAYWWADRCAEMGRCDAYYCWNEPLGHDDKTRFACLDAYQMWFRERILVHGMEAIAFNFGTGNFTRDGPNVRDSFPNTAGSFIYFGDHEYSWPTMMTGEGYYCMRWPTWLMDIGRPEARIIVTECGLTQAVIPGRPDEGWRSGADGVTDDSYLASLRWYHQKLASSHYVIGAALFNFAGYGWRDFEHLGWPRLPEVLAIDNGGGEPPNGGNDMAIKIYDFDHGPFDATVQDWAWLVSVFGDKVKVHPVTEKWQLEEGQLYAAVDWLDAKVGDTSLITNVRGEDGKPLAGITNVFYWPDAPAVDYPNNRWFWTSKGVVGDTNVMGDDGPGMGGGAYYGPHSEEPPNEGPHCVWLADLPSEMVSGLGMLPGGDPLGDGSNKGPHAHLNVGYRLKRWSGGTPPPTPPTGDLADELRTIASDLAEASQRLDEIAAVVNGSATPTEMTLEFAGGRVLRYKLTEAAE